MKQLITAEFLQDQFGLEWVDYTHLIGTTA